MSLQETCRYIDHHTAGVPPLVNALCCRSILDLVLHVGNCGLWLAGYGLGPAKRCFQYRGRRWA